MNLNAVEYITLKQLRDEFYINWPINENYRGLFVPLKLKKYNLPEDYIEGDFQKNEQKRQMNHLTCYLRAVGYKKDYIIVYMGDTYDG